MNAEVKKTSNMNEVEDDVVAETVPRSSNPFRNVFLKKHPRAPLYPHGILNLILNMHSKQARQCALRLGTLTK